VPIKTNANKVDDNLKINNYNDKYLDDGFTQKNYHELAEPITRKLKERKHTFRLRPTIIRPCLNYIN